MLMADRAGLAIEHARAYERELSNVEMLQRSLLPDRLPELDGIQVAARYMPGGADVGGDWYDAIPLEGGRVGVAMGDVVGHGIGAAALMGQLRHAMRAYALEGHSPAGVLDRLDRVVRSLDGGQMATLLYLVMEPDHGTVRFASAGPRAAARDQPGRRGGLPRERAEPAARRVRQPGAQRDRAPSSRPGPRSCSTRTASWRSAASRSTTGSRRCGWRRRRTPCHPDELCDRLVDGDARDPPGQRRHRGAGAARAAHGAAAAAPRDPVGPDQARPDAPRPGQLAARGGRRRRGGRDDPDGLPRGVLELDRARLLVRRRGALGRRRAPGRGRVVLTVRDKGHWIERGPTARRATAATACR